ncbi:unnamed protein product [Chondrus crispus]|uniref:Uncharacterized protein n=1 Tax=Chondrus crispus TaxID=2769 RepID=R7QNV5_CHOCR|nr:unnamed protein product [Chondrus crispus]CDF39055.1 unnamed protein product [Chondrus crispus]|eukprot:XP_005718966.1 unnamed protein product [Chondrus crispus]
MPRPNRHDTLRRDSCFVLVSTLIQQQAHSYAVQGRKYFFRARSGCLGIALYSTWSACLCFASKKRHDRA